ncbi:SCO3933 family regulatory protein [Actinomadura parmotrematis]|uniref:Regulatory protein n=1 Tax=Actinomadura parmotrematis TaxID=2864039 RepID=A0ABS7G3F7_9ACTN|nr:hypothetical protein [Actinomadura parmotrematis]MBW8487243.1 hypothetical protein [Actinomadura parmotrematis]
MRNIPVDVSVLTFVCVSPARPKLISQETGEIKTDKDGNTVFTVGLAASDEMGRVELVNVSLSRDPGLAVGQVVRPVGLAGMVWEAELGGKMRWGIAYRAADLAPVAPVAVPSPVTSADTADAA